MLRTNRANHLRRIMTEDLTTESFRHQSHLGAWLLKHKLVGLAPERRGAGRVVWVRISPEGIWALEKYVLDCRRHKREPYR